MAQTRLLALATAAALSSMPALADPAPSLDDLASRFGRLEDVQQISLSPDGRSIAFVSPLLAGGQQIFVAEVSGGAAPHPIITQDPGKQVIHDCTWINDARLFCRLTTSANTEGILAGYTRLIALNRDGSGVTEITREAGFAARDFQQFGGAVIDWTGTGPGHALLLRQFVPEGRTGSIIANDSRGLGVEDIDGASLARRTVEKGRADAQSYITDGRGTVRIVAIRSLAPSGYMGNQVEYDFRKPGSREWTLLSKTQTDAAGSDSGFTPVAVDPADNLAYGFERTDGRDALYTIALDGSGARKLVLARPDVDIGSVVRFGRDRRVVGAAYSTETNAVVYFDPALKALGGALAGAIPGHPAIDFVDASADGQKLLIEASSDVNPGTFYLFDKTSHHLGELLPVRGALAGIALGTMKPVTYSAADGTAIPGYLTLPPGSNGRNLPAIVLPHGGPSSRDVWGFDWMVQFFAARGFAVLQPNFRGSAGYGIDFYQKNGFRSWTIAIGDVNDAGRWLVRQGIAAPGKLAIVGWSYGDYAALQSSVLDPQLYKAIVAIAPVTDLGRLRSESENFSNALLARAFIGTGSYAVEGSPAQNAGKIVAPVLLFHGVLDQNVSVEESRLMAAKLRAAGKSVDLVEFPGLDHQLTDAAARTRVLTTSDAFLRKALALP